MITPPPFDPLPLRKKGKLLPADAGKFSWMQIYEHYDRDVIARYAKWVLEQKEGVSLVIDLHGPVTGFVSERRRTEPGFVLSGDGVHLDDQGHRLMADAIHKALYGKPLPDIPAEKLNVVNRQQQVMHAAWLSHVGHKRPGVRPGLPLEEARAKAAALANGQSG